MARRLTSSDWDAVLGSSSLRRISESRPWEDGGGIEREREVGRMVMLHSGESSINQKASSEGKTGLLDGLEHLSVAGHQFVNWAKQVQLTQKTHQLRYAWRSRTSCTTLFPVRKLCVQCGNTTQFSNQFFFLLLGLASPPSYYHFWCFFF